MNTLFKAVLFLLLVTMLGCSEMPFISLPVLPSVTAQENIAKAFQLYKGQTLNEEQFGVVDQPHPPMEKRLKNGFYESQLFVLYWPTSECVEGYTVFERCTAKSCDYRFEWVEGVCD